METWQAPLLIESTSDIWISVGYHAIQSNFARNEPCLKRYSLQQLCSGWVDESHDSTLTLDLHFALCWVTHVPCPEDHFDKNQAMTSLTITTCMSVAHKTQACRHKSLRCHRANRSLKCVGKKTCHLKVSNQN